MAVSKEFLEAASNDEALRAEVDKATFEALGAFLKEKGLEDEATKAAEAAVAKVAEAHGFKLEDGQALDLDELDAVAGGTCSCTIGGSGSGNGKQCFCFGEGKGYYDSGVPCSCPYRGYGRDE